MTDGFDLDRFLPYLLNQAAEAASRSFAQVYRTEYGMTRTQWRVIAHLGQFGSMTAAGICRAAHVEKTKVSRAVAALEARGWLRRDTSPEDRRAERLSLTAEGRDVFVRLGDLAQSHDRRLRSTLGDEAGNLVAVLERLRRLDAGAPDDSA